MEEADKNVPQFPLRAGLSGFVAQSQHQKEIILVLLMLAMERGCRVASMRLKHENRTILTPDEVRDGLKYEILLGSGEDMEIVAGLVCQGSYDRCMYTDAQYALLMEAIKTYGRDVVVDDDDDDDELDDCATEEDVAKEMEGRVICDCDTCVALNELVPAAWEKWNPPETRGFGFAAKQALEKTSIYQGKKPTCP